jgi:metal-responsive CopG/Arc/MetJ family transcriptional regulator
MWNSVWYHYHMPKKIIQVPMPADLLEEVDSAAQQRGESRSAFIRGACEQYIASATKADLIRQDVEGYTRFPESASDSAWRTKNAAEVWGEEDWDEEDL